MGATGRMSLFTIALRFACFVERIIKIAAISLRWWPITAVGSASDLCRELGTSGVAAIWMPCAANLLRQFSHGSVKGQCGLRIWLSWLPFNGLNHS